MINKQYKDRMNKIEQGCKRSVDFVIAACCLVVFSPLALVCALAIRKEDGLPVIYKQERIGLHGKPFYIYKFRSMRIDAEKDPETYESGTFPKGSSPRRASSVVECVQRGYVVHRTKTGEEVLYRPDHGARFKIPVPVSDSSRRHFLCHPL